MKSKRWSGTSLILVFLTSSIGLIQGVGSEATIEPDQLNRLITGARSKADHENLAQYFEREAQALQEKADRHQKLAEKYEKGGSYEKVKGFMLRHCNAIIRSYRQGAEGNLALAKMHRQLAAEGQ